MATKQAPKNSQKNVSGPRGVGKEVQKRGLNLFATTPSDRQPLFETSETWNFTQRYAELILHSFADMTCSVELEPAMTNENSWRRTTRTILSRRWRSLFFAPGFHVLQVGPGKKPEFSQGVLLSSRRVRAPPSKTCF